MQKTLTPRTKIKSEGRLHYNESAGAWNILKFKKDIFSEFPQLKEKRSKFLYKLAYHRSPEELKEDIEELIKEDCIPLLLFLHKETCAP